MAKEPDWTPTEDFRRAIGGLKSTIFRAWLQEFKVLQGCRICGEKRRACLVFHHRNAKEKEIALAALAHSAKTYKQLRREVNKCDVLCANCHRVLHFEEKKK